MEAAWGGCGLGHRGGPRTEAQLWGTHETRPPLPGTTKHTAHGSSRGTQDAGQGHLQSSLCLRAPALSSVEEETVRSHCSAAGPSLQWYQVQTRGHTGPPSSGSQHLCSNLHPVLTSLSRSRELLLRDASSLWGSPPLHTGTFIWGQGGQLSTGQQNTAVLPRPPSGVGASGLWARLQNTPAPLEPTLVTPTGGSELPQCPVTYMVPSHLHGAVDEAAAGPVSLDGSQDRKPCYPCSVQLVRTHRGCSPAI